MYSQMMSRHRTPARGRLKGQNALTKRPGRFERRHIGAQGDCGCLEEEADSIGAGEAPERASGLILTPSPPGLPQEGHCLAGDTPILMADGTTRALADLKAGDAIFGTVREHGQRRYVKTQVLARWSVIQGAVRLRLEGGTEVIAGGGHRFLTSRGWKLVSGSAGADPAQHLVIGDRLLGTGAFAQAPDKDLDYRRGYLCGLLRGYASPEPRTHSPGRVRLAQRDPVPLIPLSGEAWQRAQAYLRAWRPETARVPLARASGGHVPSFRAPLVRPLHEELQEALRWPATTSRSWSTGFLAGIFDAAGSYDEGVVRFCHPDPAVLGRIGEGLRLLGIERRLELTRQRGGAPAAAVRVEGGLAQQLRFFHSCDPATSARRDIAGQPLTSGPGLAVVAIEPFKVGRRLHDITTGTGDFIANGVVSHNWDPRNEPRETLTPSAGRRYISLPVDIRGLPQPLQGLGRLMTASVPESLVVALAMSDDPSRPIVMIDGEKGFTAPNPPVAPLHPVQGFERIALSLTTLSTCVLTGGPAAVLHGAGASWSFGQAGRRLLIPCGTCGESGQELADLRLGQGFLL